MASQTLKLRNFILMPDECDRKLQKQTTASQSLSPIVHARMSEPNPSHLPEEDMALPSLTQTTSTSISERHHSDPPTLWMGAFLGSVAIHVVAFGGLGLLLIEGFPNWRLERTLIPVEVIAVAPEATTPSTLTPSSTTTRIPTPPNTPRPRTSAQRFNPQTSSTATPPSPPANSQSTNTQPGEPSQFQKESPATNPAQNEQPKTPASPTTPDSSPTNGTQPGGSGSSSNQNPVPPVEPQGEQPSPSAPQGFGFRANLSPLRLSGSLNDTPERLAITEKMEQEFPPDSYAGQLIANLNQPVALEVFLLIDRTGAATIQSVIPVQGDTSVDSTKLARAIIQNWEFKPTYNKDGQAFDQTYQLTLQVTPRSN